MSEIAKVVRDGKVAVLKTSGHEGGWYSWNTGIPQCLFDPEIVALVEAGDRKKARTVAEQKWPNGFWGGYDTLEVEWIDTGTRFRIDEYDGEETLVPLDHDEYIVA